MCIYLDNHATTAVDPRVVEAMVECFRSTYGNAGSVSHAFGWKARELVDRCRETVARCLGATPSEVIFTSGATESNNLVIRGLAEQVRRRGDHVVSVTTEHKAVLDPLARLRRRGMEVTLLSPGDCRSETPGQLDPQTVADAIRDDTFLVSVMLANNEIGVLQPLREIVELCHERGVVVHSDATQAVGKVAVDWRELDIDLISFSAHKLYGPKGVGGLIVRRRRPRIRLSSQIDGGGQERGLRSGTLNVPGIVGLARALELCEEELAAGEPGRLAALRQRLYDGLAAATGGDLQLNGPPLDSDARLPGNLNCAFPGLDGEALMMNLPDVAVSSGSACTSANPEPSHVLRAIGLGDDLTRASLRFGIGRFNTPTEIDTAVQHVAASVRRLRSMRA